MTLVDTSIWVDHLARTDASLIGLLNEGRVVMHPYVIGEIALGHLRNRSRVLSALSEIPQVLVARDSEVVHAIQSAQMHGAGIGYVDAHLLTSCLLSDVGIWTRDRRLAAVARRIGIEDRRTTPIQ